MTSYVKKTRNDYTVAWLCALPKSEFVAAQEMLDDEHESLRVPLEDNNSYHFGSINGHNVVIACLPPGMPGTTSAVRLVQPLRKSFPNLKTHLFVGIGGGIPQYPTPSDPKMDIHLGDVVIGWAEKTGAPAVVQWDFRRYYEDNRIELLGQLDKPARHLLNVLGSLLAKHCRKQSMFAKHLEKIRSRDESFSHPGISNDKLYMSNYIHVGNSISNTCDTCDTCDPRQLVCRPSRKDESFVFHQGTILSGTSVVKDAKMRDEMGKQFSDAKCFEMEAAGVIDETNCLVIRGISDYTDSHKNDLWQDYAAATAAAFAREFLYTFHPHEVEGPSGSLSLQKHEVWCLTDQERECLRTFRSSDYENYKARNPDRVNGTCQWFLGHKHFIAWRDSQKSCLLWVSADPGCGKSVLAKSLVDKEIQSTKSRTTCYFFFKDDGSDQRSITTALSALLHQLFSQNERLIKHAMPHYDQNGPELPTLFHKQWDILISAAADPEVGEVVCILDAVDECEECGRNNLIEALSYLYNNSTSNSEARPTLKFLVTSRPYFHIERSFRALTDSFPTIRLAGENEQDSISEEIDIYTRAKVSEIAFKLRLNDVAQTTLEKEVSKVKHRTYLWLYLIFEVIEKSLMHTPKKLQELIGQLPDTVDKAYTTILERSPDKKLAQRLLHIVVSATRPLTLREMNVALYIKNSDASHEDLDLEPEDLFPTTVKNLCGLFVSVINSRVYLIHQTAKEFLVSKQEDLHLIDHTELGNWKHSLKPAESNSIVARLCITYLLFDEFESYPLSIGFDGLDEDQINGHIDGEFGKNDFLRYTAETWVAHFQKAHLSDNILLELVKDKICNTQSSRFKAWFSLYPRISASYSSLPYVSSDCEGYNDLTVASNLGLDSVVRLLLETGIDVEDIDNDGWTALRRAAESGHKTTVQLLLERGANKKAKDDQGHTALSWAIRRGHEVIVRLLLKEDTDVEVKDYDGQTLLHLAVECWQGDEGIIRLLIQEGADINAKDNVGMTALLNATCDLLSEPMALLLAEEDTDFDAKDAKGFTPLS